MKNKIALVIALVLIYMLPLAAQAGEPRLISSYNDWDAYVFIENGSKVCYMVSKPKSQEGEYNKRGEVFALVTHRPSEGTKNVFSYIAGYSYKPGSDATVEIDGDKFALFTQDDTAWAPDADNDEKLAKAIRSGSKMTVRGMSSRGTETKDTFSLKGSGAAHDKIDEECR